MKNIKYIASALLIVMSMTSCNDYLNKAPENVVDVETVDYTKLENMYEPVSGVYAAVRTTYGAWSGLGLINVRADDTEKGSTANDQIELQYCKNFEYDKIRGFWALNATWEGLYKVISISNSALESLAGYAANITTDADRTRYSQYVAEIQVLRSLAYFRISQLWGDAPLLLDNQQLEIKKSTLAEVRAYMVEELTAAAAALPAIRPNEQNGKRGAVTQYTALALLAKVELYNGNYDAVITATNTIISSGKFSLYGDFYNLFKIPGKLCDESLFEVQFTDFGNGSGEIVASDNWFAFQGPRGNPRPIEGWGFLVPSKSIIDLMEARGEEVRYSTTVMFTGRATPSGDFINLGQPGEPTSYAGKAYTPKDQMTTGRDGYGDNNNIRVLRYADVLLMSAEAKVRKGQSGDSEVNIVRSRAGMTPLTGATIEQIMEERRVELAMEWGERFYDLVRTGTAAATLPGFVAGKSDFYPIPQNQIDLNPNLK